MRWYTDTEAKAARMASVALGTFEGFYGLCGECLEGASSTLVRYPINFTRQDNYAAIQCTSCGPQRMDRRRATDKQIYFIASLARRIGRDEAIAIVAAAMPEEQARYILNHPTKNEASTVIELLIAANKA